MNRKVFTLITITLLIILPTTTFAVENVQKPLFDTLMPTKKNCSFVVDKLYQPFSGIDSSFPGIGKYMVKGKDKTTNCIRISDKSNPGANGVENIVKTAFTLGITLIIVLTVISISVAGIQFMTEEAVGKKGAAKKRLADSFIALGLGLLSFTILYTVNRQLVEFSFDPSRIDKDHVILSQEVLANIIAMLPTGGINLSQGEALMAPIVTTYFPQYNYNNPGGQDWSGIGPNNGYILDAYGNVIIGSPVGGAGGDSQALTVTASYGSISCNGQICTSSKPTVFGYLDGNGTVGTAGDNGIGNGTWSDKAGCTYDNWNTYSMGVALPKSFWSSAGIAVADVKYLGIKVFVNGVFQRVLPVVDDSQSNLDFTFAAAKALIDPTITNSNNLNTSGKAVTFSIVKDYYKLNPKTNVIYIIDDAQTTTGTGHLRNNIRPCNR